MDLRIGLIGVGKHGTRYARHLTGDVPGVRLVAIARRDLAAARAQAEEFGCRAYADYRDLLRAPDIDAVAVVVPPTLHPEVLEEAAVAGRPVLLEKPAAASGADGARMVAAVRRANLPVMVAQTLRFNEVVRTLQDALPTLGRLHAVRISQRFEPSRPAWIDNPAVAGGGITLHTGVHSFDLARLLSGLEPDRVSCEMGYVLTSGTEDNFVATVRFGGGAVLASIAGSRASASRSGPIELAGEHGQLIADHIFRTATLIQGSTATPLPVPSPVSTVRAVVCAFADALRHGTPMPITLDDGLRAVAVAEACYRAARTAEVVDMPGIEAPRTDLP
ncbi:Gfo/Idh/MocA family oxidoreductase [Candidatus Binatia bacterium]|nr:Gfo/Idh/MocA family oxidoreductase [Candidatus Binatia bacterium]